ncbi:DinB family protein [Microbacterium sp.]|uniref:DinB family protein n=1 Tax=Microbacterium sp. TaxID=51671 RepID=UPI0037CBD74B
MTDLIALLRRRHTIANSLYLDLLDALPPDRLRARLPGVRSSPVSNHFWCVVGARESYVRAARAGSWQGFDCSLADDEDADQVRAALEQSAAEVDAWLGELDPGDADSIEVALRLLEHETQHHGQLIRYLYAVPLPVPASWVQRYVLEPE